MGDCSNFECPYQTWGDKIRCSKCRRCNIFTCASCGCELNNNRQIRCKDCSYLNKREIQKGIESQPEKREQKRIWGKNYYNRKKQLNKTIPVN